MCRYSKKGVSLQQILGKFPVFSPIFFNADLSTQFLTMYPAHLVAPMSQELETVGFQSLHTPEAVQAILDQKEGTTLVMVNSVCGCAARNARPAAMYAATQLEKRPDRFVTVFAGVDEAATATARDYFLPYPPSSPAMALFKNGELVHFIERHQIEGRDAGMIAANLKMAFDSYC